MKANASNPIFPMMEIPKQIAEQIIIGVEDTLDEFMADLGDKFFDLLINKK